MLFKKALISFAALLLAVSLTPAQTPLPADSKKEEQRKKAKQEIDKKAVALVYEVIEGAQSLKLPENRIRMQIRAADLLWPHDETRARALFKEATDGLRDFLADTDLADSQQAARNDIAYSLRNEIVQMISAKDAKLALDFLRATRQPSRQSGSYYGAPDSEAQLEMRLAAQIADKDPEEAFRIAVENLPKSLDHEVINLLYRFQATDKARAAKLLTATVKQLREENLQRNHAAVNVAITLLRMGIEAMRASSNQAAGEMIVSFSSRVALDEQVTRELSEIVTSFVLSNSSSGAFQVRTYMGHGGYSSSYQTEMLLQLKPFVGDIEKLAPTQAAALRKVLAQHEKKEETQNGPISKIYELVQSGTLDALMEAIPKAPPEMRDNLYQQAIWKAINQGEMERAAQIVNEHISNPTMRSELLLNLDRNKLARAGDQANLEEMRRLLPRIPSVEERVGLLVNFASIALSKREKAMALQLLNEAQSFIGQRAENYGQMNALLNLAQGYSTIEHAKSLAIIGGITEQVNGLAAAASVMNGFDIHYFKDGEMILYSGNSLIGMVEQCATQLGALARRDFDGAKQVVEQIRLDEARLMARLIMARSALETADHDEDADNMETNIVRPVR